MDTLSPKFFRPSFIDHRDEPWIKALIAEYQRFEGLPVRAWKQRLKEPLPFFCPHRKLRYVLKAFEELYPQESAHPKKQIQELRQQLFEFAESFSLEENSMDRRSSILERFGNKLLAEAIHRGESFDSILFADLPSEKRLAPIQDEASISEVILTANTHLVKGIIQRSQRLEISLRGQVRPIVRQALLRGLICVARPLLGRVDFDASLALSGPLGLFRHTRLYGRLLMEIAPFLPNCDRFVLFASVPEGDQLKVWMIKSGDPIRPANTQKFDSQIEKRFFRAFPKAAPDYDLIREPQAVMVNGRIIFPDFAIKHRTNPEETWLLEIVGYWTSTYLRKKIEHLQAAKINRLIICVSRKLACSDEWPTDARLVYFDRWVDPVDILRAMAVL